ncbi:MAG: hypothetical protein ABIP58_09015 [Dehalococcoidia bacterium]
MRLLILPALALTALFLVACGDSGEGGKIEVTLTEWEISIDKDSVPRGPIEFTIKNDGDETHEFVVIKTDIAADELETTDDGSVDEDAPDIDVKQEVEDIESGDKTGRTYELDAGSYVLICNIVDEEDGETESHYENGMRQGLAVEEK